MDDEAGTVFDHVNHGNDFFESLEGMLVTVKTPTAVSPSNTFSTTLRRMVGVATTAGMNVLHAFVTWLAWLRTTLFTSPWDRFLRASVTPADLRAALAKFPAAVRTAAEPLFKKLALDESAQRQKLAELISAGQDRQFGPGGEWTPATAAAIPAAGKDDVANFHPNLLGVP